jgi:hypothetical protein
MKQVAPESRTLKNPKEAVFKEIHYEHDGVGEEILEIEANNFDVIEKEIEKERFEKEAGNSLYSHIVLFCILLMYMSNQWQRFCKFEGLNVCRSGGCLLF